MNDQMTRWQPLYRTATRWQEHHAVDAKVIVRHRHIYHSGDDTKNPLWEEQITLEFAPEKLELAQGTGTVYPRRRR